MKYLYILIALLVFFAITPCSHAEEDTTEAIVTKLTSENEALKSELEALRQQISSSRQDIDTPKEPSETSETDESKYLRESSPQTATPLPETTQEDSSPAGVIEDKEIEEIVVTATRTRQAIKDVGSSISVITRKDIENSKAPLLLDILRRTPGIEVTRTQGIGGTTSIFMRGGNSAHTLVFIDGVQVNSPTTGSFNFANLTTDNIERVEILRGPQSTLYGSEAIGGVINIFTKKGKGDTQITLGAEYGTHETYRENVNVSGGKESHDYSMGLSYLKTHGISNASSGREEDGYENFTGSARLGYNFLEDGRADTTLRVSHADFELDTFQSGVGAVDDPDRRQKTDEVFFSAKAEDTFLDIWTPSLLVSVNDSELEGFDPTDEANEFRIPTRLWRAEHQSDINLFDIDTVTLGYEYEVQEGENEGRFDKQTTWNRGAFFQNQIKLFDSLNWTAGLRYDRHSSFGVHYTYRTTLSYDIEWISIRPHGSWGKGFRAPSINELFFPDFGNPGLNPEESKGWDFGIEKEIIKDRLTLDVTYFENDFTDLIVAAVQPDGSFRAENVARADAEGFETALTFRPIDRLSLTGMYTYTDTTDRGKNDQLPRRPANRASLTLDTQPIERLNVNLMGVMVRDRIDSDGTEMDDYWIANLATRYELTKLMSTYLRFENIFDRDYEEVTGFSSLDLTMYGGLDFKF